MLLRKAAPSKTMTIKLIEELNALLIEAAGIADPHRKWNLINKNAQEVFDKLKNKAWHSYVEALNRDRK